jgi:hypothetical protein
MIGIYQDSFLEYLKKNLGYAKLTSKNIITVCPWCEYQKNKGHYHLYISLEAPIFHCFEANCEQSGILKKFLLKIEGKDISDTFVDKRGLQNIVKKRKVLKISEGRQIITPPLNTSQFMLKDVYIKQRLKYPNIPTTSIKGLVYDIDKFIEVNNVAVDEKLFRMRDYLQANFVGFLTENKTTLILRNISNKATFRFFKMKVGESQFLDYYKLSGLNRDSNTVILAEGIFDIFTEYLYDSTDTKFNTRLYASVLSSKYQSLLHSIVFNEQLFRPDVVILSDRGIELSEYRKLKKYNAHIINSLTVYYNKTGKDFNETPVTPEKFII